jgi:plasmid stabilization system protein ParE
MIVLYEEQFINSLKSIVTYIAHDKKSAAYDFKTQLLNSILNIPDNPRMYRKSFYNNNENYRDMIFMGYTITYKIEHDSIKILDIFKWQNK